MYSDIVGGGLTVLNRAGSLLRQGVISDSLVEFTSAGRVEPLVLIEQPAMHLDCIGEVQQSVLSIFAGYYLQAASLLNTVNNVRVMDRLDVLNPNRNPVNTGLSTWLVATEAYQHGLPFPDNKPLQLAVESNAGMGSLGGSAAPSATTDVVLANGARGATGEVRPLIKQDVGRSMTELANLSVGKVYEITITDGKHSVPVMVNIRLIASMMPTQDLIHILATGSEDNSFKERWHGWKSGRLSFWKDLVLCNDLIEKHRSDLLKDKTGTLSNINRTNLNNTLSSLVSGSPTISSSTNIVILTKDSAEELEMKLEGKLSKFDVRQRLMKETSLMLLVVVDEVDYNMVTIYHRGIPMPTTVRIRDLKAANKGDGPSITDIMKALMSGHAPAL